MSWIDKIYCKSKEEARELLLFLKEHRRRIFKKTGYKYPHRHFYWEWRLIFNFPELINTYLARKCKIPFVQNRLKEQYWSLNRVMSYKARNIYRKKWYDAKIYPEYERDIAKWQNIKLYKDQKFKYVLKNL